MINITESTREKPCKLICECGKEVNFAIHNDYIEGGCVCGKFYVIAMAKNGGSIWNCCSSPDNGCGYNCNKKK